MRILAITSCYPHPERPGHCIYHQHKMRALAKTHEMRLIVPVPWRERIRSKRRSAGSPQTLKISYPTYWYSPKILEQFYGRFFLTSIKRALRRAVSDFRPEVVFACWAHPDGWAALQIGRELGVPVVIKVIGSDVLVLSQRSRRRAILAHTLRSADRVIAVSRDLADHVIQLGVDPQNVHVVPEGIDTEIFSPGDRLAARNSLGIPHGTKMALFVGNLLLAKGAGVLIEACAALAARIPGFRCYLVGKGKDESALRRMLHGRKLEDRIIFAGPCAQNELVQWYRAADVVALPSFSEGIPNVLREAIQCRRPFVATRVGGIPEISDPSYSRLVTPGNVGELVAALESMLASTPVVDEKVAARINVTWTRAAEMITDVFGGVCQADTTSPDSNPELSELSSLATQ